MLFSFHSFVTIPAHNPFSIFPKRKHLASVERNENKMYKNKVESSLCVSVKCHIFIWNKARYGLFVIYILSFWFSSRDALDVRLSSPFRTNNTGFFFWYSFKYKNFNRYKAASIPSTPFSYNFLIFFFFSLFLYHKFPDFLSKFLYFRSPFFLNFLRINFFSFFLQF